MCAIKSKDTHSSHMSNIFMTVTNGKWIYSNKVSWRKSGRIALFLIYPKIKKNPLIFKFLNKENHKNNIIKFIHNKNS
jgi:hypothetical protein